MFWWEIWDIMETLQKMKPMYYLVRFSSGNVALLREKNERAATFVKYYITRDTKHKWAISKGASVNLCMLSETMILCKSDDMEDIGAAAAIEAL